MLLRKQHMAWSLSTGQQPNHHSKTLPARQRQQQLRRRLLAVDSQTRRIRASAADSAAASGFRSLVVEVQNPEGPQPFSTTVQVPPRAQVYQVALKKPLGVTLTELPGGVIAVDELLPQGHAQQAGVAVGDVLLAVTARAQDPGSSSSTRLVLLQAQGQSFKAVAAGLRSNTCAQCRVVLLLQRRGS